MTRVPTLRTMIGALALCSGAWLGMGASAQAVTVTDSFEVALTGTRWCEGNPKFVEKFTVKIDPKHPITNTTLTFTRDVLNTGDLSAMRGTINNSGSAELDAITLNGEALLSTKSGRQAKLVLSGVHPVHLDQFLVLQGPVTLDKLGNLTKVTGTFQFQEPHTYTIDKKTGAQSGPVPCFTSGTFVAKLPLVLVPNVVGQSQAAAAAAIVAAKLTVGTLTSVHHATVPAGSIVSEHPAAGTSVTARSVVTLVVSTGPAFTGLPPNPVDVAPPLDATVATTVASGTAFLYTGAKPIQTGVAPGTIVLQRAAVLRGKVIDRAGLPLPGVVVTILSHPEFGQTRSRADGMFDLVVNGGGLLTLCFATPGYINAQRQVSVPWQDWVVLEDTALVAYDPHTTLVDLSVLCDVNLFCRAQPMQVVRGTPMTDADGTRQATLLVPSGTTATLTLPGKPAETITHLTMRATEFTVGPTGPQAMPANLPPTSGYTYEVEFSVDEAEAAGATRVSFSQPVLSYTENFLHFPVGTIVPYGEYDRTKGVWIPMPNGLVIQILSIDTGMASLDLTGSGQAADAPALAALGISAEERQNLATLYTAGQTLWRVPLSHFLALK